MARVQMSRAQALGTRLRHVWRSRGRWWLLAAVVGLALITLVPPSGTVLVTFRGHGLHTGDLLVVVPLLAAGGWLARRSPPPRGDD